MPCRLRMDRAAILRSAPPVGLPPGWKPLGFRICSAALHQDVQYDAVLIDSAPEIAHLTLDADENLIQMPLVTRPRSPATKAVRKAGAEFQTPSTDALTGDDDATFSQQQLHVPLTDAELVITPHRVNDELRWEVVTVMRVRLLHPRTLTQTDRHHQLT